MAASGDGTVPRKPLVAVGFLVLLAGCGGPPQICGACGPTVGAQASHQNVYINVQSSSVTIQTYRNGSARWIITNNLTEEGITALRQNQTLATEIARNSLRLWRVPTEKQRYRNEDTEISDIDTSFDGNTFFIRFWLDGFGERAAGDMLLVDELHHAHSPFLSVSSGYRVNTEQVTLRAPPGMVIVNDPPGASVSRSSVQWSGGLISKQTYLVFAEKRSFTERARANVFIAKTVFDWAWPSYVVNAFAPVLVLGGFVISRLFQIKDISGDDILGAVRTPIPLAAIGVVVLAHVVVSISFLKLPGWLLLIVFFVAPILMIYTLVGVSRWRLSTYLADGILLVGTASTVSLTFALGGTKAQYLYTFIWLTFVVLFGVAPIIIYETVFE